FSRKDGYRHTFVPFFMAIIDEECYEVYYNLLKHLDLLVRALTEGDKTLKDVVRLCVHDAHQGALEACKDYLPSFRNGTSLSTVKRHKYCLHASPTDDLYSCLSTALITAVEGKSDRGGRYLRNTLNVNRLGYPNIAITRDGLIGTQVLDNIVESFHKTVTLILSKRRRLNISKFAARIRKVITSMTRSSPQHFVQRPE
ncbi:hypothetical protein FOZ62_013479, partial [Perkinsus olseni]